MKMFKKIITAVLAVAFLVSFASGNAFAAKETYKYTVTFLAGAQGTFASTAGLTVDGTDATVTQTADKIVISGLEAGDTVSFNAQSAVVMNADSKHYVQGVRLSGRDNDTVSASAFTVTSDEDYVVAYGIKGNQTSYTVEYKNVAGYTLAESDTYYGNVGDKPVVAYKYIEGYRPQVLGYTKTLSENVADNIFTFVYEEVVVEDIVEIVPGTGTATPGDAWTGGTGTAGNAGGAADTSGAADEAVGNAGAAGTEDGEVSDDAGAEDSSGEIIDLDDEEVPLASAELDEDDRAGIPMVGMIAMLIIALVALANVAFYIVKHKNR